MVTSGKVVAERSPKATGSARVYGSLREEILRMQLAPAAPLDEVGLSERFGLSRSPVREALVRLSSEGLVVMLPNRSTIVAPIDFQGMPHFLDALDLLQRAVTRSAAIRRTDADLATIKVAEEVFEDKVRTSIEGDDSLPMIEANHAFHMAIARAGKNAYYVGFYRRLLDESRRMLHMHFEYRRLDPDMSVESFSADHIEMVAAISAKDAEHAERVAHAHATQFRGRFMQFLERNVSAEMRLEGTLPTALSG